MLKKIDIYEEQKNVLYEKSYLLKENKEERAYLVRRLTEAPGDKRTVRTSAVLCCNLLTCVCKLLF